MPSVNRIFPLRVLTAGAISLFLNITGAIAPMAPVLNQAVGALGELSDKSDFSLHAWDSFSQEIRNLLLFYCQKSLNLLQMQ